MKRINGEGIKNRKEEKEKKQRQEKKNCWEGKMGLMKEGGRWRR